MAYEQKRDVVVIPSIGWLRRQAGQDHYTVANGLGVVERHRQGRGDIYRGEVVIRGPLPR